MSLPNPPPQHFVDPIDFFYSQGDGRHVAEKAKHCNPMFEIVFICWKCWPFEGGGVENVSHSRMDSS